MHPNPRPRAPARSLLLPCALGVVLLAPVRAQSPEPSRRLPEDCLALAATDDAVAWARAIGELATPLPAGLDPSARLRISAGLAALRAATGCTPGELVELLAPGPAAAGLVLEGGRPRWFFASTPERGERIEALLAKLPVPHRWHGDGLHIAADRRTLDAVAAVRAGEYCAPARAPSTLPRVHVEVDVDALRRALGAPGDPIAGLDAAARFLIGPWVDAVAGTGRLALDVVVGSDHIALRGDLDGAASPPWDRLQCRAERSIPTPDALLGWIALDRSFASLFDDLEAFLGEGQAVQAEASLGIFDAVLGPTRSFEQFLALIREPASLLFLRPAAARPEDPKLVLPGLALVAPIEAASEDAVDVERALRDAISRTTGALSLIVNAERRQQNRPGALVVRGFDDGEGARGVTATFTPWRGPGDPPTEWGVRATVALGEGHLVVASTDEVAEDVFAALRAGRTREVHGDSLFADGDALAALLERNRRRLELDRVLDRGDTFEEAAAFWNSACAIVRDFALRVDARHTAGSGAGAEAGSAFAVTLTRRQP